MALGVPGLEVRTLQGGRETSLLLGDLPHGRRDRYKVRPCGFRTVSKEAVGMGFSGRS